MKNRANDTVSRRAYSLFLAEGARDGQDIEHWLRAESEILTQIPDVRQSSSEYTLTVPVQGFAPEQIHVDVDETGVLIAADKREARGSDEEQIGNLAWPGEQSMFFIANWPGTVDPATASAQVKEDGLTLTVKRADANQESVRR